MNFKTKNINPGKRRIWRSAVMTLAAIVVFITTYALIIPAITWEKTLICELEEHVHTDNCYNSKGVLKCGKEEHKHTADCFDAPKAAEKLYICGKPEHTHTDDCYFSDGTLKCTMQEHYHTLTCKNNVRTITSEPTSDGTVAVISGVLPKNAQAEISELSLSEEELIAYFGTKKAESMEDYVAYDIRIMADGEEWQPDDTVSVTLRNIGLETDNWNRLNLAHVEDGTGNVTEVEVLRIAEGDVAFETDGFSTYVAYLEDYITFICLEEEKTNPHFKSSAAGMRPISTPLDIIHIANHEARVVSVTLNGEEIELQYWNIDWPYICFSKDQFPAEGVAYPLVLTYDDGTTLRYNVSLNSQEDKPEISVEWNDNGTLTVHLEMPYIENPSGISWRVEYRHSTNRTYSTETFRQTDGIRVGDKFTLDLVWSFDTLEETERFEWMHILDPASVSFDKLYNIYGINEFLDLLEKPEGRTESFSEWVSHVPRYRETEYGDSIREHFGKYELYRTGNRTLIDPYQFPVTVEWNDTLRQASFDFGGDKNYKNPPPGQNFFYVKDSSGWHPADLYYEDHPSKYYEPDGEKKLGSYCFLKFSNKSIAGNAWEFKLQNVTKAVTWDIPSTFRLNDAVNGAPIDSAHSYTDAQLLNYVDVDVSGFGYGPGNDVFTTWLTDYYVGNPDYGSPAMPTKQTELGTAFHYFYTGEKKTADWTISSEQPQDPGYQVERFTEPTLKKQIDYLGNNGTAGMDDLYRLYLSLDLVPEPLDLLLVLDQSGSMESDLAGHKKYIELDIDDPEIEYLDTIPFVWDDDEECYVYEDEDGYIYCAWDDGEGHIDKSNIEVHLGYLDFENYSSFAGWGYYDDEEGAYYLEYYYLFNPDFSGTTREEILLEFLNGKESDNSDGFISQFRRANDDNHIAILSFSDTCTLDSNVILDWDSDAVSIHPDYPDGATNYMAALNAADLLFDEEEDCQNKKVMIFLSDGIPTFAFLDGKLHSSTRDEYGNLVTTDLAGGGDELLKDSLLAKVEAYISNAYSDSCGGAGYRDWMYESAVNSGREYRWYWWADEDKRGDEAGTDYSYPRMYDLLELTINVPGIDGMWGDITDETELKDWYEEYWSNYSDDQKIEWIEDNTDRGEAYDIFYLTENAFLEFRRLNSDVSVYSVAFAGSGLGDTLTSGREASEVLMYMSGDLGENPSGRYYHCAKEGDLQRMITDITRIRNVSIDDPLTEYVDLAAEPKLEITMTLDDGTGPVEYTLYGYDPIRDCYDFTDDGNEYLDTAATKFDADGRLHVVYKPEASFDDHFTCEVSFNVAVNDHAKREYADSGYNATGDNDTDRPGNNTSSLLPGFYSNDEATASWTFINDDSGEYPNPVVQVSTFEIQLKKIDAGSSAGLSGAKFDLYREDPAPKVGHYAYTDGNGTTHYLKKINTIPLESSDSATIEVEGLVNGTYYLFETQAPVGYVLMNQPIVFEATKSGITLSSGNKNARVNAASPLLLEVKNFCSYAFPATGAAGTETFYEIGALLMFGALMIGYILWRRREGRGEF